MAACACKVRDAVKDKVAVIDVDGSYLDRKHEQLRQAGVKVAPLGPPSLPLSGWITINEETNYKDESQKIPRYTNISPLPSLSVCVCVWTCM